MAEPSLICTLERIAARAAAGTKTARLEAEREKGSQRSANEKQAPDRGPLWAAPLVGCAVCGLRDDVLMVAWAGARAGYDLIEQNTA